MSEPCSLFNEAYPESTESLDGSNAEPHYEFQLSFAFDASIDRPCFVLPDRIDQHGKTLPTASSLFLSHSNRKSLLQFDLEEQNLSQVARFTSPLTSLCVFPFSSQLLVTQEKKAFILDPREKLVVASVRTSHPITKSAFSSTSFQLYTN